MKSKKQTPLHTDPFRTPDPSRHTRPHRPSWYSWVPSDADQLQKAEEEVLFPIRGLYEQAHFASLNTLYSIADSSSPSSAPVVLLHGFAGGAALWMCVWEKLVSRHHTLYAVDLPGFGRSCRVPYKGNTCDESIHFFLSQLIDWVEASKVPTPFCLVGHSLGAYLSAHLAMQRPDLISKLILVDPFGVREMPHEDMKQRPYLFRIVQGLSTIVNPLTFFRATGKWGAEKFAQSRDHIGRGYSAFFKDNNVVPDYMYHCNAKSPPSGETAFFYMHQRFGWARRPLEHEFVSRSQTHYSLSILYGENTWMDIDAGKRLVQEMLKKGGQAEVLIIPRAGHNCFSDNYDDFTDKLLKILSL